MRTLILLAALLLLPTLAGAEGVEVFKSTCKATVTAPQTKADGTNLDNLKEYGVYVADSTAALVKAKPKAVKPGALVGAAPMATVPAAEPDPIAARTATWDCSGLSLGQKYIQFDAVNVNGTRSVRTAALPFLLKADPPPPDVGPSAPTGLSVAGP